MAEIQNMVGGFLSSAVSNIFSTTTNKLMAVGIVVALLVGTYFIYKWYVTSFGGAKKVQFAAPPAGPQLQVHEVPPPGASMMPPNVEGFQQEAEMQQQEGEEEHEQQE